MRKENNEIKLPHKILQEIKKESFTYQVDERYDKFLEFIMDNEGKIDKIKVDHYYIIFDFDTGERCNIWNTNRWYGWGSTIEMFRYNSRLRMFIPTHITSRKRPSTEMIIKFITFLYSRGFLDFE